MLVHHILRNVPLQFIEIMLTKRLLCLLSLSVFFVGCASVPERSKVGVFVVSVEWTKQYPQHRPTDVERSPSSVGTKIVFSNSCGREETKLAVVDSLQTDAAANFVVSSSLNEWCRPTFDVSLAEYLVVVESTGSKHNLRRKVDVFKSKSGARFVLPNEISDVLGTTVDRLKKPLACGELEIGSDSETTIQRMARDGLIQRCGDGWGYSSAVYWEDLKSYLLTNPLGPVLATTYSDNSARRHLPASPKQYSALGL